MMSVSSCITLCIFLLHGDQLLIVNMALLCFMLTTRSLNNLFCLESKPLSNCGIHLGLDARNGENWPLVTGEPIEFEKFPVQEDYWRWYNSNICGNITQISVEKLKEQNVYTVAVGNHTDFYRLCPKIFPDTGLIYFVSILMGRETFVFRLGSEGSLWFLHS